MKFSNRLLDHSPASVFELCYPIGNGSFGAMANGGTKKSIIYLNDDSFWAGSGKVKHNHGAEAFIKAREATMKMNIKEAENILWKDVFGNFTESYLPLGELHLERNVSNIDNYTRYLDLSNAIHSVSFGSTMEKCFVSHPLKCFAYCIQDNKDIKYKFSLYSQIDNEIHANIKDNIAFITMYLQAPTHCTPSYLNVSRPVIYDKEHPGMKAILKCAFKTDGKIVIENNSILISNASFITTYATSSTSFREGTTDFEDKLNDILINAVNKDFSINMAEHSNDFSTLYNRASIQLDGDRDNNDKTTIDLLKSKKKDISLELLLFNFGRYLMISGSRNDSNCMNLQGIWNCLVRPPWSSNYTTNINTEMNYWGAEATNLSECHLPMFKLIENIAKEGHVSAKEQFNMNGWCLGQNADIWGSSDMTGKESDYNPASFGLFIGGGGWMASHIWMHYEYTLDKEFLSKYYDILKGCAEFYLDYLVKDNESDYLIVCPSASPENSYRYKGFVSVTKNSTIDATIIRQILNIVVKASKVLNIDFDFAKKCQETASKIYPYKIGKHGELLEWYDNYPECFKHHRHISHLYGLHPDNQISPLTTPKLANACKKTLHRRGNGGTGWSIAWKINMYARLFDGNMAIKLLDNQLNYVNPTKITTFKGGTFGSMLCAHPPFQIDGNFGALSGITEMLLQSHTIIHILPALPNKWHSGAFKGLVAKGGYIVNCKWINNKVTNLRIDGPGTQVKVLVNNEEKLINLNENITL